MLACYQSNENYGAVISFGVVYYAEQSSSNSWVTEWNSSVWPFKWKLTSSSGTLCCQVRALFDWVSQPKSK